MKARAILERACGEWFTAAVLRVEHRGEARYETAVGRVDDEPQSPPVTVTTRFDLASLTKPVAGAVALHAVARNVLALDEPLVELVPEWQGRPHAAITLRALLAHTSGMHSGADYRTLLGRNVEGFALTNDLAAPPLERVTYSDLGFISLGVVLERALGKGLAAIVEPLATAFGASTAAYRPAAQDVPAIPATECDAWRGRVRGTVHDEKCQLMNGVAGHAGLFGTARDVAAVAEVFLAPLCGRGETALPSDLSREAVIEHGADPVLRRGLGWALKTRDDNSCGTLASRATFGHTGFTGTCVWADPARDASVVLLTNAVYFGRRDLRDVRAAVCDAVFEELDACARSA